MTGNELRNQRLSIGLSQSKLAEISEINQAKISSFELGKSSLSEIEINTISKAINAIDVSNIKKLKKKRYRRIDDGHSIITSRSRIEYTTTSRNREYLNKLNQLERLFKKSSPNQPKALSFFAGCGGLCYGIKAAGFDIIATNELVEEYKKIYKLNFPNATFLPNDIRDIKPQHITPFAEQDIDLFIGGPPCQGFSLAGKRDVNDDRNTLFQNYLDIADLVRPKVIIIENVRLLTSMKNSDGTLVKDDILETFKKHGYNSDLYELNAKNFGVPQSRERVFFIGVRSDLNRPLQTLEGIYGESEDLFTEKLPVFTFGDATSDLEPIESGEASNNDIYHKAVKHPEHVLRWLVDVPEGKSAHDNQDETLRPPSGYNTTYKRQLWNQPGATVGTTFSMISGCNNVHPFATRSLTIREALRLQSFPDSFQLTGKLGDIRTTIGNAVPPLMAYEIGKHVLENYIL